MEAQGSKPAVYAASAVNSIVGLLEDGSGPGRSDRHSGRERTRYRWRGWQSNGDRAGRDLIPGVLLAAHSFFFEFRDRERD